MSISTRTAKRRDSEILKVTCLAENVPSDVARFVVYLDSVQEWHSFKTYVSEGKTGGWTGRFSSVAEGLKLAYVRLEDPWAVELIRSTWS
jgi:hypothetical protein